MVDGGGEVQSGKVYEIVDAPASFKMQTLPDYN